LRFFWNYFFRFGRSLVRRLLDFNRLRDVELLVQLRLRYFHPPQRVDFRELRVQIASQLLEQNKPYELPEGWVWCRLGDIAKGFQYGSSTKSLKEGLVPVLRMGNLQNGEIDWKDLVFTKNQEEIYRNQADGVDFSEALQLVPHENKAE